MRSSRALSSWLRGDFLFFDEVVVRDTTAGTADRWDSIFVEVSCAFEYRGSLFRT